MIWTFAMIAAIVAGWYWFEGRWDRKLFHTEPGRVCVNLRAPAAKTFLQEHPETQVLDVRSNAEFQAGALPNATHISISDPSFEPKVSALDRQKPVLIYCAGGYRSRKAVERLKALDFTNIQHLHRGYMSWRMPG